jgi:hypothetical protein
MHPDHHDYILDAIQQFADFVGRLGGLRDEKRYDEADEAIEDALRAAFGPMCATLDECTPESVVALIGDDRGEKLHLYVALLRERARTARARGQVSAAGRIEARVEAIEGIAAS